VEPVAIETMCPREIRTNGFIPAATLDRVMKSVVVWANAWFYRKRRSAVRVYAIVVACLVPRTQAARPQNCVGQARTGSETWVRSRYGATPTSESGAMTKSPSWWPEQAFAVIYGGMTEPWLESPGINNRPAILGAS